MIDILTDLIAKTKSEFEIYLKDNKRDDLLPKIQELFNYRVQEVNNTVDVCLEYLNNVVYEKSYEMQNLNLLSEDIKNAINVSFDDKITFTLNIEQLGRKVFKMDLKIEDLNHMVNKLHDLSSVILNKIGLLNIVLMHNNTKELVSFGMRINRIDELIDELNNHKDVIYNGYVEPVIKKAQHFYGEGSGDASIGRIIEDVLVGNFIVDEFDNFIADENGNCLVFE
jgi:hypothetical protein